MKLFVSAILFSICNVVFPIENSDSLRSKLNAGCTVSLNSNGIASIPAFSLDKPAIMASVSLAKGRFSYSPILAYGLDLKPWFIDNWLHYKLIKKPAFELRAGFNSAHFSVTTNCLMRQFCRVRSILHLLWQGLSLSHQKPH
jgi:hypothetical protein